ncbi:hypothetical protein ACO1PK_06510 [Alishewanella sp. d11]|uniref:hypothetical protein n=1 Tax=Alishewanella sp. d11 TaxID=3414030 RepID=UPI003BF885DD
MKQTTIVATLMLIIGLALGYYLAPKVSEPLKPLAASMPATTSAAVLPAAKSPAQLATTPTAPVAETSSAVDEKALPAFFASGEPFAPANSYTELLQQLSYDGQQQLQQLNSSLLGMFEFNDSRDYRRLLEQGMPTPAELEVLFNVPFQQQVEQIREKWQRGDSLPLAERQVFQRHAALLANLAYDELERQYHIENPDYQGGRMPDYASEDWPPAIMEYYDIADSAYIMAGSSDLATARLAALKRSRLVAGPDQQRDRDWRKANQIGALALIGTLLKSDTIYETYAAQQGWTEAEFITYSAISAALLY